MSLLELTLSVLFSYVNTNTYYLLAGAALVLCFIYLMRPRRFYLVRHGETLLNAEHVRQGPEGALSEKGRAQADSVGQYLENFPITHIVSSTYPRALETAEIINTHVHTTVTPSPLFEERRNPSAIIGKHTHDSDVVRIVDQMDLAFHDDDFRVADEENFIDELQRAKKALSFLAHHRSKATVVVTHHHFLKMHIAYILYRENLHASDFIKLSFFNVSDNAGISTLEFNPWDRFSSSHGWSVIGFNEQPE